MSERNVDSLAALFHDEAVFVHMGGTMSRSQELDVIKSGGIHYKNVDIQDVSVRFIGDDRHPAEQDSAGRRRRRQRGGQSVHGDGGVRPAERHVEARLALVHSAAHAVARLAPCSQATPSCTRAASLVVSLLLVAGIVALSASPQQDTSKESPLAIREQGSFAVGGGVVTAPGTFDPIAQGAYSPAGADPRGQTLHGDHAYVFYQVPVNPRPLPLVLWHGHGQSGRTWETTPDGREGFQTIFLRRRFPVYVLDQPRRGRAARSTQAGELSPATPDDQLWFGIFRLGVWPDLYPGVQFSRDRGALDQFFRQMVPNTGPYDVAGEHEGRWRPVRQDRPWRAGHPFAERHARDGGRRSRTGTSKRSCCTNPVETSYSPRAKLHSCRSRAAPSRRPRCR